MLKPESGGLGLLVRSLFGFEGPGEPGIASRFPLVLRIKTSFEAIANPMVYQIVNKQDPFMMKRVAKHGR